MKAILISIFFHFLTSGATAQEGGWVPELPTGADPIGNISITAAPRGIVSLPRSVDPRIQKWFDRYTKVVAPNGKPIHILAQGEWRDDQIVRARNVLQHILTDVPGTTYGADKGKIANAMADRRATLVLFNTERAKERAFGGGLDSVELGFQDLRANECPVEGDPDYLRHETRDAAFEEILHLVHDYGIRPVYPEFDEKLHQANLAAAQRGLWHGWPEDEPWNHRNEYFAAIYDDYLDLWALKPLRYEGHVLEENAIPDGTSHFGAYGANSRAKLLKVDPTGYRLIEEFFPPFLTYTPELPATFKGTFHMRVEPGLRYTYKSQHLVNVCLTGENDAGITGNGWNNVLRGNEGINILKGEQGDDTLCGAAGNDLLFGGAGVDVAVYAGKASEYRTQFRDGSVVVIDEHPDRDGVDILSGIEKIRFSDTTSPLPTGRNASSLDK